jgi:hypothetical protein
MASRAEAYEANARVCEQQAELLHDPQARETYLELAKSWRRMARDFDLMERGSSANDNEAPD